MNNLSDFQFFKSEAARYLDENTELRKSLESRNHRINEHQAELNQNTSTMNRHKEVMARYENIIDALLTTPFSPLS